MDSERISACTYPLRAQPFDYALEVLAAAGLRKADLWGRRPHFPEDCDPEVIAAIAAASARTGVSIANLGTYPGSNFASDDEAERAAELESMKRTIDAAAHLGCRSIRVMPGRGEDPAIIDRIAPLLAESAEHAEIMGVLLGMENHRGSIAGNPEDAVALCAAVGSPWFGVLYEPCNLLSVGVDYRAAFEVLSDWIVHVHVKDGRRMADGSFQGVHLGRGEVDPVWVVEALESIGYTGEYALEYEIPEVEPVETGLRKWVELFAAI